MNKLKKTTFAAFFALTVVSSIGRAAPSYASVGSGSGGGGKTAPVVLPADWPANVPVPAGTLLASLGKSPHWVLQLDVAGNYPDVMAAVTALYVQNGYTDLTSQGHGFVFNNGVYNVTAGGAARDHSTARTIVNIYLDKI